MKIVRIRFFLVLALTATFLSQCGEKEIPQTPPAGAFTLAPASGLTTTLFRFDATGSKSTNTGDTMLFIRWDWDNDNIWDTGFSRSKEFTHRYFKPGSYSPRMEIRNEAGLSDTIQSAVQVARGYSAPQPAFTISPSSGNLRTEFVFDANQTRDDEDSLNTLKFRWDWEGDGIFDTGLSTQTIYTHSYNASSIYDATVEVVDPQGLTATLHKPVSVSTSNPNLVPIFTWSPLTPSTADTVQFDASTSYDPENPGNVFTYRWNFTKDTEFDTDYSSNPITGYQFKTEGENEIILEIKDQWGLINQTKVKLWISHANLKPTAGFFVGYDYGNRTTNFYFDADATKDGEDYIDQLKIRWDFESDGVWDTEFAKEKTIYHKYATSGKFRIKMQVIDTGGLSDTTSQYVNVSEGTNETGLILDKAKSIYYGTVKIGTQWWMSENLNEASKSKFCYSNQSANCATYGGLYTWTDLMNGSTSEEAKGICPTGWHVPALSEWQQLLDVYGTDLAKQNLEVTGTSDFRMFLAGQRNINGRSEMLNTVANFWTSSKATGENAWAFSFQKDQAGYFKLNLGQGYYFSVRCVKD